MAVTFTSATLAADGRTLTLVTAGWTGTPAKVMDFSLWPVVTVGAGGHANTLRVWTVGTPTDLGGGSWSVDLTLVGYAYDDETATITVGSGFLNDGTDDSPTITAQSVTNDSIKTQGDAYTRFAGAPIVAWAARDYWVHHDDETAVKIGLDAFDSWSGIDYIDFTFSASVTVATGGVVTDQGSNVYRVSGKRLVDLGAGTLPYWYLSLNISAASDGAIATISAVTVRTKDGVDHSVIASGDLDALRVRKKTTKTIRYVDGTNGSDSNDGTSWALAWASIAHAESNVGTTVHTVKIAPGTYTVSQDFDQSRTAGTHEWIRWEADASQAGDGSGAVTFTSATASRNLRVGQAFKNIAWTLSTTGWLRLASSYTSFEGGSITATDKTQSSGPLSVQASHHIYATGLSLANGNKITVAAVAGVRAFALWFGGVAVNNQGTCVTGACSRSLFENFTETLGNADTAAGTHTDGFHSFATLGVSAMTWTESTRRLSKASAFTNVPAHSAQGDRPALWSFYATGGTGVTADVEYPMDSKIDASTLQVFPDLTSGGDQTDVAGSVRSLASENVIVRNWFQYDGGDPEDDKSQNVILWEGGTRNFALYNCRHRNVASSQQVYQIASFYDNVQMVGNTSIPTDNDAQADERGLNISGIVNNAAEWYRRGRLLVRNNAIPGAGTGNPGDPAYLDRLRACLVGPNYYSNASPADGARFLGGIDGSNALGAGGVAAFDVADHAASPPDFRPESSSPLLPANGVVTSAPDDRWFDALNNALAGDGTDAVGAIADSFITLTSPADGAVLTTRRPEFDADGGTGPYTLKLVDTDDDDHDFDNPNHTITGIASFPYTLTFDLDHANWDWRVEDANGVISEEWSFTLARTGAMPRGRAAVRARTRTARR